MIKKFFSLYLVMIISFISYNLYGKQRDFTILKAINISLEHNNDILIQKENVNLSKANIKIAASKFDTLVNPSVSYSHTETPLTPSINSQSNSIDSKVLISKQLRTGIALQGEAETTRIEDISNNKVNNKATILFSINIPLLEGLGIENVAADELAAKSDFKKSKFTLLHTISKTIYQTAKLYWDYKLSFEKLKEYRKSLDRTKKLLNQVRLLIKKNARPKSDITQILASYAEKKSSVENQEFQVIMARNALLTYIGVDNNLGLSEPLTKFPVLTENDIKKIIEMSPKIKKHALLFRYDYKSLQQSDKTIKIQLVSAIDKLKNNLDLNINFSYQRLEKDKHIGSMFETFWENKPGFNFNMLLNYKWPIQNNYAKGLVLKFKSLYMQNQLNEKQLKRSIFLNIDTSIKELAKSYQSLNEILKSIKHYQKAIENEKEKYKMGVATILDVINIESQLTDVNLKKIANNYNIAVALAKFRYESGKLIVPNNNENKYKFNINNILFPHFKRKKNENDF